MNGKTAKRLRWAASTFIEEGGGPEERKIYKRMKRVYKAYPALRHAPKREDYIALLVKHL